MSVPIPSTRVKFNTNLEALRGFAAFTVVLGHTLAITESRDIDPVYQPSGLFHFAAPGHLSVLLFFILSGYVIGLNNKEPLTKQTIWPYLQKRLFRLYPIYLISLLFAFVLAKYLTVGMVLANLTLSQILLAPVVATNGPLWSIHYEMLFYLLFIPLSLLRFHPLKVCATCVAVGLANLVLFPWLQTALLTSYCFGFAFWSLGLWLATFRENERSEATNTQLLSAFLLFFTLERTNQLHTVITKLLNLIPNSVTLRFPETVDWSKRAIELLDFSFLPYCVFVILIYANKEFKYKKWITALLYILPSYTFFYLFKNRADQHIVDGYLLPCFMYVVSVLLLVWENQRVEAASRFLIRQGVFIGGISYGLYVIHYPILKLFGRVDAYSGTLYTFVFRFILFLLLSFLAAYVLDKQLQPRLRDLVFGRRN